MRLLTPSLAPPRRDPAGAPTIVRWAICFAAAVALAIAAGALLERWHGREPELDPGALVAGFGPATYGEAVARADADVAAARERWQWAEDEWLRGESLARALIARHRLTGNYADLAAADRLLDDGLRRAPAPSGPVLSRASLSLLLHRLPQADSALARIERWAAPSQADRAEAVALSGDIAQQRGRTRAAFAAYGRARTLASSPGLGLRHAVLLARTGERDEARRRLETLLRQPRLQPRMLSELMLHRAQLAYAVGEWEDAGHWIDAANRVFPGYWLAQAYAAQQLALDGSTDAALRSYAAIAERTNSPEVMDALAQLLRLQGRREASLAWWRRADAIWRDRLAHYPEAAALHAAEHALIGGRPGDALALAQADVARRPHGATLAVLARTLIVSGRPRQAIEALDRAEAQGWVSAGLLMLRAEAAAALGGEDASAEATRRAEAINPRAADPRTQRIWFGHD